ncbi:multicopper oxidase family protein [Virgibacillus halophilus]|uniref:Multicopper oxidase n=1 Tax=Tigheibacillus halophilus TaxID=361280 RepID=A0ABU5C927_9BACI|nr:multicopper oxidase [Virgibacillus halophilus]
MSITLRKFVDRLPKMSTIKPKHKDDKGAYYEVRMTQFMQRLHRDMRPTMLWGYNGQFPGPLFDVKQGEPIQVKWMNDLPSRHILPVDLSLHGLAELPEVRTVTHLHGGVTQASSDGYPDAWFTRGFEKVGPDYEQEIYHYPNNQPAAALWYHDHAMGITRLNMYAGLAGMYIIRDEAEKTLYLPEGKYELPLIVQDRSFKPDGSLDYPRQPDDPEEGWPDPSVVPFFLGDTILVNGKVWPYAEVEPRKYRLRILNASNTRAYALYLDSEDYFYQIGTDGGLMQRTTKAKKIPMEPAERVDLIVDFTGLQGKTITLKNDLGPNADPEDRTNDIMQFRVNQPLAGKDNSNIPRKLIEIPSLKKNKVQTIRDLKLVGTTDELGRPLLLLNNKKWMDEVTEKPRLGDTEIWSFKNLTTFTHPIHIHLVRFQVLDHRPFDLDAFNETGILTFTGPATRPKSNELGWKDTIAVPSATITRVIAHFVPYAGEYVWHCHILEHEDYDMMRPFTIVDPES